MTTGNSVGRRGRGLPLRLSNVLMALYPTPWRARYEDEYREVLNECRYSFVTVLDIVVGAVDARLHYGEAVRRAAACRRKRARRAVFVAALILWAGPVALVRSPRVPYRPIGSLLG